jgi:tetratricopeptide (TPR) repeat protein
MLQSPVGVILSNVVARNINISGVTVVGASAQEIADLIIRRDQSLRNNETAELTEYREIYSSVTDYIDEFRGLTATLSEASKIDAIIKFLNEYISFLKTTNVVTSLELIEGFTSLGMLYRLYGQYLQLLRAREVGAANLASLRSHRENLTATGSDKGNFSKSESILMEALQLSEDKLGLGHLQTVVIRNELGLLHRDKGQYKQACLAFNSNLIELNAKHPSEKVRAAEAYLNMGLAYRDRNYHVLSAWFFWAAGVFAEAGGSDAQAIRALSYRQLKYAASYTVVRLMLFGGAWLCVRPADLFWIVATILLYIVFERIYFSVLDRVFVSSLLTWAIEGLDAVVWPRRILVGSLTRLATAIVDRCEEFSRRRREAPSIR